VYQVILEREGFREVEIRAVPLTYRFDARGDLMRFQQNMAD
jgi:hypothetical protein